LYQTRTSEQISISAPPSHEISLWYRYNCTTISDGSVTCWTCSALPTGAQWIPYSDPGYSPCAARCNAGLYGQPLAGGGSCLRCSLYMQSAVASGLYPPPPTLAGVWNDTAGRCDADSWACTAGYRRSPTGARYCCPLVIPNSSPAVGVSVGPCGVVCDAGFWWDNSSFVCAACSGLSSNANWTSSAAGLGQVFARLRKSDVA
jgi:hypothetical protein